MARKDDVTLKVRLSGPDIAYLRRLTADVRQDYLADDLSVEDLVVAAVRMFVAEQRFADRADEYQQTYKDFLPLFQALEEEDERRRKPLYSRPRASSGAD